jgi:hypothetical protein
MLSQFISTMIIYSYFLTLLEGNRDTDALYWMKNTIKSPLDLKKVMKQNRIHAYVVRGNNEVRKTNTENFIGGMGLIKHGNVDIIGGIYISSTESLQPYITSGILSPQYNAKGIHQRVNHGRLACQLSLVTVLQTFLNSSNSAAVVFEDDVNIASGFSYAEAQSLMASMLRIPAREWDLQYLGFCFSCDSTATLTGDLRWVVKGLIPLCTHAIVFNRRAAKIFLDQWAPLLQPGDVTLSHIICKFGMLPLFLAHFSSHDVVIV